MFKKFTCDESVSGKAQVKSSVQRSIVKSISDQFPDLSADCVEVVLPKKSQLELVKCQDHINLVLSGDDKKEVLFFNQREGPYYPTLRFLHKAGDFMPIVQVDTGAIKPLIGGAALMCPGIQKENLGDFEADTPVQIMSLGKKLPFAVGITKMSSDAIKSTNTGVGVEILHTLGDGLWNTPTID